MRKRIAYLTLKQVGMGSTKKEDRKMRTMTRVEDVNSQGIKIECEKLGLNEIELLSVDGTGDNRIRIFQVGSVRVMDTNGDPVWEESDPQGFSDILAERGIEL